MNITNINTNSAPAEEPVFADIVEQCQAMVFNTVLSIVQTNEDAEDITQDVFIEVYEKLGDFRKDAQLTTWVYRIAVNKALDWQKRKKRQKHGGLLKRIFSMREEEEPVSFEHPGATLDNKEKASALFKALKQLPEKQQVAFTLHKIEGLPYSEVAAIMETTVNAVESLIVRAKSGLQKILETYYRQQNG